jgi:SAM-dependent methyltransferase
MDCIEYPPFESENSMQAPERRQREFDPQGKHPAIMDYDDDGYDYRTFWKNRDYEQWAERRILRRLFNQIGQAKWLVDLGGGFGRNAIHYHQCVDHAVIVDYSKGNLVRAASTLSTSVERGIIFLVRADLYRLPFVESAFDVGLLVRVLHHLTEVETALMEMGRVVGKQWILDIPIKHHLLARLSGLRHGDIGQLSTWKPKSLGTAELPFSSYHLGAIRQALTRQGWETRLVASANNFRRWDQVLPSRAIPCLRPLVYSLEALVQTAGRGWWGPSQFVCATRCKPTSSSTNFVAPPPDLEKEPWAALATKMCCPVCLGSLQWSPERALCPQCSRTFLRTGAIWDFVPTA